LFVCTFLDFCNLLAAGFTRDRIAKIDCPNSIPDMVDYIYGIVDRDDEVDMAFFNAFYIKP
jgi:hypothetical protein